MIKAHSNGINVILGDEMGLGKTLQTISFLGWLKFVQNCPGPYLIVVPLSVLSNWSNEFKRFLPAMRVLKLHSSDAKEKDRIRKELVHNVHSEYDVVITTYEVLKSAELSRTLVTVIYWKYIIFDEGHVIKNECTVIAETVRRMHFESSMLLTGTPLQNDLHELWSLLNFLHPDIFKCSTKFDECFNINSNSSGNQSSGSSSAVTTSATKKTKIDYNLLLKVHAMLKSFMLRRIKADVEKSLPPKIEKKILCPLTPIQTFWYKRFLLRESALLIQLEKEAATAVTATATSNTVTTSSSTSAKNKNSMGVVKEENQRNNTAATSATATGTISTAAAESRWKRLRSIYIQLRKVCNHPFLFEEADEHPEYTDESIITASGKLLILDKLLHKLKQRGHRVVIFSQYTRVLDIIGDYLSYREYEFCRLDGSTNRVQRQISINMFNSNNSPYFAFIMTTRAGGLGVNLQTADTVILYDSDWNPQADMQAMARVHRIGQKKVVHVYRLVAGGTVEERIVQRAEKKLFLDQMVNRDSLKQQPQSSSSINNNTSSSSANVDVNVEEVEEDDEEGDVDKMGADQLLAELRFGADEICNSAATQLTDADIEELVSRQTGLVITSTTAATSKNKNKNTTSSASASTSAVTTTSKSVNILANQKLTAKDYAPENQQVVDTRSFQGVFYHKYSGGGGATVAAPPVDVTEETSGRKTTGRNRKNRLVKVKDDFGVEHDVMVDNLYDLQHGESSVFDKELKGRQQQSQGNRKLAQVAGVDYTNEEFCLKCWDGGNIVCCDKCPTSFHDKCVAPEYRIAKNKVTYRIFGNTWMCPHHRCMQCHRNASAVGGLLFRCSECDHCYCEDHLPVDSVINGRCFRLETTGYILPKQACYIYCSDQCATFAESYVVNKKNKIQFQTPQQLLKAATSSSSSSSSSTANNNDQEEEDDENEGEEYTVNEPMIDRSNTTTTAMMTMDPTPRSDTTCESTSITTFTSMFLSASTGVTTEAEPGDGGADEKDPVRRQNKLIAELLMHDLPVYLSYDRCHKCHSFHEYDKCPVHFLDDHLCHAFPEPAVGSVTADSKAHVLVCLFKLLYQLNDDNDEEDVNIESNKSTATNRAGISRRRQVFGLEVTSSSMKSFNKFMTTCTVLNLGTVVLELLRLNQIVLKRGTGEGPGGAGGGRFEKNSLYIDIHPDHLSYEADRFKVYEAECRNLQQLQRQQEAMLQKEKDQARDEQNKVSRIEITKVNESRDHILAALSSPQPRFIYSKAPVSTAAAVLDSNSNSHVTKRLIQVGYYGSIPFTMRRQELCEYLLDKTHVQLPFTYPVAEEHVIKALSMLFGKKQADKKPLGWNIIGNAHIKLKQQETNYLVTLKRPLKDFTHRVQTDEAVVSELVALYMEPVMTSASSTWLTAEWPGVPVRKRWITALQFLDQCFVHNLVSHPEKAVLFYTNIPPVHQRGADIPLLAYVPTLLQHCQDCFQSTGLMVFSSFLYHRRVFSINKTSASNGRGGYLKFL